MFVNSHHLARPAPTSTARSMMTGRFSMVLAGAFQFGHGVAGLRLVSFIQPNRRHVRRRDGGETAKVRRR